MEWLRLRMANIELEQRVTRERSSIRRPRPTGPGDVIQTGGDVIHTGGDMQTGPGDVIQAGGDVMQAGPGDVMQTDGDVTPAGDDATLSPSDVTPAEDDVSAVENASVVSNRASPVPDDVTFVTEDVTGSAASDVTPSEVSGGSSSAEECVPEEDETPDQLRQRCRRQRRQLRGLKRRVAQLQHENAALRMRRDPDPSDPVQRLDPAALVEDIKQAAAETAAQLAPSGLAYQPETGLYYDHDSGYYWDPARHMYYDGSSGYYLRYDETSGAYVYVESADGVQPTADPSDPACDPASDPGRRRSSSGEELEEGEIEEEDEDASEAAAQSVHWTSEEYWTRERTRQARPEPMPDYSPSVDPAPAVFQSGPRSPQSCPDPPWLRMIVTDTKVEGLRLGSLHVATMDGLTVGRDPTQQLHLEDANLSKFHAVIGYRVEKNDFYIRDLGSRNGTFVDERRISAAKQESEDTSLPHGCQLRLGSTCLLCHVHAANDTCLQCEPGQTQERLAAPRPPPPSGDPRQQRRHVANRIKQKYGLRAGGGAAVGVGPGYADRAAERRLTKGSDHPSEKTQTADVRQAIPEKNKGFRLLRQMGWQEGEGLGRARQGIVEPVSVEERGERRGLGCRQPEPPTVGKAEKRRTELWQKTQERFNKLV